MNVQVIEKDGKIEWAVIPYDEYQKLSEAAEMLEDIRAYDEAKAAMRVGEELIPSQVVYAILDGANPIRVWREYRQLTQEQLAGMAGISEACLTELESSERDGTAEVLQGIAQALAVDLEDLVEAEDSQA